MPEWDITATTVHCVVVDDEVTILIGPDAAASCTGRRRGRSGACEDGPCRVMNETVARFVS